MAKRPSVPCRHPACPAIVPGGTGGYCDQHKKQTRKQQDQRRGSSRDRGYTATWDKVREIKKQRDPLCEVCLQNNIVRPMELVHHIKPINEGGALLDLDNCLSVCRKCHAILHGED